MLYRLGGVIVFFFTFAIQARYLHIHLAQVPYYAGIAAWLFIISERKLAIEREVKFIKKELKRLSK